MARTQKVNWKNNTAEAIRDMALHSEENYLHLILQNYLIYNSKARSDIANLLFWKYKEEKKANPEHIAALHTLFSEIYAKYIQVTEDLALIGLILLKLRPVVDTFMESNSNNILDFYERAHKGFSKKEVCRMIGFEKMMEWVKSDNKLKSEERQNIQNALDDTITTTQKNLKNLAGLYLDKDALSDGKYIQGGVIDVYNSIKHGYKLVHPTKLAKKMWKLLTDEALQFMHRVIYDESSDKKFVMLGGFEKIDDNLIEHIMLNIKFFSDFMYHVCQTKLLSDTNPDYLLKKLRLLITKAKISKGLLIKHYHLCPCGSHIKYKKCCALFDNVYSDVNTYEVIDI